MALTATPNWEVSATVADRDKNLRSFSFNLPSALTFAAATAAAEAIITAATALINGVIVRYGLLGGKYESTYPATLPPEGSDVERKGVFVFNTTVFGQHVKVELPSINNDYVVDGSKCISYFTIELKEEIPKEVKGKFEGWAFGCDICQDVCPWNRFSKPNSEAGFTPIPEVLNFSKNDWEELTEASFKAIFKNSPLKRTKFEGIKRNLHFIERST